MLSLPGECQGFHDIRDSPPSIIAPHYFPRMFYRTRSVNPTRQLKTLFHKETARSIPDESHGSDCFTCFVFCDDVQGIQVEPIRFFSSRIIHGSKRVRFKTIHFVAQPEYCAKIIRRTGEKHAYSKAAVYHHFSFTTRDSIFAASK